MEASSLGHGKPLSRISTGSSSTSLDETLAARANRLKSLLSESVTLDSLSSKSGDTLPTFPRRKLPAFSLIGLGDRLKLFSTTLLPYRASARLENAQVNEGTVVIGAPTSPRLKKMLKECLSIKKWAESSTSWQAPGHIPWESVSEGITRHWLPEGSYFSPEHFSLALLKARGRFDAAESFAFSISTTGPSRNSISIVAAGSQDTIPPDFFDVMLELDGVESFFPDISEGCGLSKTSVSLEAASKLSVPSLVVSDSHFTFPLVLESSSTLSRSKPSTIALRRGKPAPPPVVVIKHPPAFDIPYPNVPTAFLGQPSDFSSPVECIDSDLRPTLHFEEMIKNLRLQCSTMELHNLPVDTSWNSRTPEPSPSLDPGESTGNKPKETEIKSCSDTVVAGEPVPSVSVPPRSATRPLSLGSIPLRTKAITYQRPKESLPQPLPKVSPARKLRSAMAKAVASSTKPISKSVRFALTRHDLEKEIALSQIASTITNIPRQPDVPAKTQTATSIDPQAPGVTINFPAGADRKLLQRSRSYIQRPSWKSLSQTKKSLHSLTRAQSLIIGSTSAKVDFSYEHGNDSVVGLSKFSSSVRSTQSLGRHSLSRLIKGPIFSSRDLKRTTTLPSSSVPEADQNDTRRETQSLSQSLQKKSRMPIPLRNILTRFK